MIFECEEWLERTYNVMLILEIYFFYPIKNRSYNPTKHSQIKAVYTFRSEIFQHSIHFLS